MKKTFLIIALALIFCQGYSPLYAKARYISLAPATTEILFALGLDEEIIGISTYCNYPERTQYKPKVGSFSSPNIEKILSLNPDYIFCTGLEQAPVVEELKRLKLNVYVSNPSSMVELFSSVDDMGKITGKNEEAARLIKKMKDDIAEVTVKVKLIPEEKRIKVFVEIWHEPLMTAGKGSLLDEMITLAGGVNIAHQVKRPYCNFSAEKVVSLNPDCIILAYMDKESPLKLVEARFGWNNIAAVKSKKVFNDIEPNILLRASPRSTEGLKELYKKFYQ
ncbi:MAG: cobalamin-binding protein [Candidatus Omnitrophota bacterium]